MLSGLHRAYYLKLEDLTRGDIRCYVSDKLQEHDQLTLLMNHDPGYENLIEEIAMRAQGVFLGVYFVMNNLLDGLTYDDSVETMLRQLDQSPEYLQRLLSPHD
ncbi:hypothetical protein N657DRAFT_176099 [Parathielavia appendiculata]|uniref:Uncharacterized protein n=1 Tax=Parathielavia appendiculata TaxID=2587402 RepID=A0AAN6Z5T5_9PEZI|nr:hypothetical protein N657DRAFT_176099 [Parathielavia appendiculata]